MKYVVSIDYKYFTFDTFAAAGEFAYAAKAHSDNYEVKITIEADKVTEDQED